MYKNTNRFMQHASSITQTSKSAESPPLSKQIEEIGPGRMKRLNSLFDSFDACGLTLISRQDAGRTILRVEFRGQILEFRDVRQARTFLATFRSGRL